MNELTCTRLAQDAGEASDSGPPAKKQKMSDEAEGEAEGEEEEANESVSSSSAARIQPPIRR